MKKTVKKNRKKIRTAKTPPPGWPSENEWTKIERELEKALPSRVLPKNASLVEKTKYEICVHFVRYLHHEDISQRELARRLRVSESRVSEIVHYHFERYTIDKLVELLCILHPSLKVNFKISFAS